ncbi:MAG: hypothetical protein KKF54_07345 [Candidatus Omnitrophica bacterium]|nr:hypothetical protein [Candidatus Omnitrophota bacterium]
MPFYYQIEKTKEGKRIAERLLALREHFETEVPKRGVEITGSALAR